MKPLNRAALVAALILLWVLPANAGFEDPPSSERRASRASQAKRSTSSTSQRSPTKRAQPPQSRGSQPRTSPRSGTWVSTGSREAHRPSHRPPSYRPPGHRPPGYRPPGYYPPYYPSWGWGWGAGWGYPYYWGGYWGPYLGWGAAWGGTRTVIYRGVDSGALDLDISPEEAQVAIDGSLVGTADDFDGYPDYLWLEQGSYRLDFFLEGYETKTMDLRVLAGQVQRLDFELTEGESIPPELSTPSFDPVMSETVDPPNPHPEAGMEGREVVHEVDREAARLYLEISPEDASVYLDGRFLGTAGEISRLHAGLVVAPGRHLVQVARPGFESREETVAVEGGDEIEVQVELEEDG